MARHATALTIFVNYSHIKSVSNCQE